VVGLLAVHQEWIQELKDNLCDLQPGKRKEESLQDMLLQKALPRDEVDVSAAELINWA
tara:strand:+ start:344 stop:517 length:174 start_codon:yes stop_codon:yes gene_type:complete